MRKMGSGQIQPKSPGVLAVVSLTFFTALASASGFIREVILAYYYGTSATADSVSLVLFYLDAINIIILSGVAGLTVVPYLARMRAGDKYSQGLNTIFTLTLFMAGLALLAGGAIFFNAKEIATLLLQSHTEQNISIASQLIAYSAFAFVPLVIANVLFSIMQAEYKYNLIPFARILFNVVVICAIFIAASQRNPLFVAWGVLLGVLAELSIGILIVLKLLPAVPHVDMFNSELLSIVKMAYVPFIIIVMTNFVYGTVELFLLSKMGEGTIAGVKYANKLIMLINGINASLQIVFFTRAGKEDVGNDDPSRLSRLFHRITNRGLLVLLPVSALLAIQADVVAKLAYERGSFDSSSLIITSSSLSIYALCVGGGFLWGMVMRLAFLVNRQWYGLLIAAVFMVTGLLTGILLLPHIGHLAIPAGYTVGNWMAALAGLALLVFLVKGKTVIGKESYSLFKIALLSVASAAIPLVVRPMIIALIHQGILAQLAYIAMITSLFSAVFLGLGWLTDTAGIRQLLADSFRRVAGRKSY